MLTPKLQNICRRYLDQFFYTNSTIQLTNICVLVTTRTDCIVPTKNCACVNSCLNGIPTSLVCHILIICCLISLIMPFVENTTLPNFFCFLQSLTGKKHVGVQCHYVKMAPSTVPNSNSNTLVIIPSLLTPTRIAAFDFPVGFVVGFAPVDNAVTVSVGLLSHTSVEIAGAVACSS